MLPLMWDHKIIHQDDQNEYRQSHKYLASVFNQEL